jgi:5'-deoxynucleotidase YfbR-like HD superfamily hydrolase
VDIRSDPRIAGEVQRYHTWPHSREQSVGEHTWQVMRILSIIYPGASVNLLHYAIFHDVAEVFTGDLPYPIKKNHPQLSLYLDAIETDVMKHIRKTWDILPWHPLSVNEAKIFKLAEYIEMWEWAISERLRGNQFAELVETRMADQIMAHCLWLTDNGLQDTLTKVHKYMDKRISEWQK